MREILFRGKRINASYKHLNGRWHEGYLCNKNHIYSLELEGTYEVDPETVCQCTGKGDVNEKKIYEGDIVRLDTEDENLLVEWNPDCARFVMTGEGIEVNFDSYWDYQIEVIGNIFDNPELQEGE